MRTERQAALKMVVALLDDPPDFNVLDNPRAWRLITSHSVALGVAPLIAYIARPRLTAPERMWCDRVLTRSWARYEDTMWRLTEVTGILETAGIQTLALKGPVLASRLYSPAFLRRPSADLDLAVRESDRAGAATALLRAGFVLEGSMGAALACSHHFVFSHPGGTIVELHFRLSHGALGIPVDEFFDRSLPYHLPGGNPIRVLAPADEILQLILHTAHDRFKPIFHLYEVRKIWLAASDAVRDEARSRAVDHHFEGVLAMIDVAFRLRWGTEFLSPHSARTRNWLNQAIDEDLYIKFETESIPDKDLTLVDRMRGRWLQLQITDSPADALSLLGLMTRIAWFQLRQRGWRTIRRTAAAVSSDSGAEPVRGASD